MTTPEQANLPKHLAISGGQPIRTAPFPYRGIFGESEMAAVQRVFETASKQQQDFGFQSNEEEKYCQEFSDYLGGGFTDAVSSGSAGIFVALKALGLSPGDEILLSPVNDPGTFSAAILMGLSPRLIDSSQHSYNIDLDTFSRAITGNTKAAIVAHIGGVPTNHIHKIQSEAKRLNIRLVEDCSQAHGASIDGIKVGNFSDVAVFSTMYSKNHATGGCGGVVFTTHEERYWKIRQHADRGKPFNDPHFNPKDPTTFLGPALNFNQDELSCAIGRSTLKKLDATANRRREITKRIDDSITSTAPYIVYDLPDNILTSPFFHTVGIDCSKLRVSKPVFCEALSAEGMTCNPNYSYVISDWPWARNTLPPNNNAPNANEHRDNTFNITFTESLNDPDIADIIAILHKVADALIK